jgi:hypothetical protein
MRIQLAQVGLSAQHLAFQSGHILSSVINSTRNEAIHPFFKENGPPHFCDEKAELRRIAGRLTQQSPAGPGVRFNID